MNVNVPATTPDEALRTLLTLYRLRLEASAAAMLWGASGVGKSAVAADLADAIGGRLALYRLGGKLPEDLRGIPRPDDATGTVRWYHDEELPTEGVGVLFLDELNTARPEVMNQAMELMRDRSLGRWRCPDDWFVMAAGNEEAHGASVFEMPVPVADRLSHFKVVADLQSWSRGWAMRNAIAPEVLSFLQARPDLFDCGERRVASDHLVDASPRGWEAVSTYVRAVPAGTIRDRLVASKVGNSVQADFQAVLAEISQYASVSKLMTMEPRQRDKAMPRNLQGLNALAWGLAHATTNLDTARAAYAIATSVLRIDAAEPMPLAEVSRLAHELVTAKVELLGLTVQAIGTPEYRASTDAWAALRESREAA